MEDEIRIEGADFSGLALARGKRHWFEDWDAVDGILVARVVWGNGTDLAAAVGIGGMNSP